MVQQMSKFMEGDQAKLSITDSNSQTYSLSLGEQCEVVTINGRVCIGTLSYIGYVHLELVTDKGKLLVMFSSVNTIKAC